MPQHRLTINNRVGARVPRLLLERILREVAKRYGPKQDTETSLAFVDNAAMANLNRTYHGERGSTDVLSFSFLRKQPVLVGQPVLAGEVIIAPEQAARSATRFSHSLQIEFALLFLHGALHIFEFDHEKGSKQRAAMIKAEQAVIKRIPALRVSAAKHRARGLIVRELVQ
jgi:probable rRNA maturation factor